MRSPLVEAWARLNSELHRRLAPERYAAWISHARPARLDEDEFIFHLESTFAREKIRTLLLPHVVRAARSVTNRNVRVRLAVEGASFPRPDASAVRDETRRDGGLRLPEQTFAAFIPGPGNRRALDAARALASPEPPFRSLLVRAPSGLGKTHLLRAAAAELGRSPGLPVLSTGGEAFARQLDEAERLGKREAFVTKCRSARALLFDDLHLLAGRDRAQAAQLEIVLALEERGFRVAMTSESHPRALEGFTRAARGRLRAQREVAIERPDASTGAAFLRACAPPGTPPSALDVIARAVRSSHKDQLWCLARLLEHASPTAAAARALADGFLARWTPGPTCEEIARAAAERFGVSVGEIYAARGTRRAADARRACFFLARRILGKPFAEIGRHFGGRGHSTVLAACRTASRRGPLRERILRLERDLRA